jgi:hypothetical protein
MLLRDMPTDPVIKRGGVFQPDPRVSCIDGLGRNSRGASAGDQQGKAKREKYNTHQRSHLYRSGNENSTLAIISQLGRPYPPALPEGRVVRVLTFLIANAVNLELE